MKLTLRVDSLEVVKWWVNSFYNSHNGCRGHTSAMTSLGRGEVVSLYLNQKLNTKISTQGELVGSHERLHIVLWSKHFIEYQGYMIYHNKLYLDCKSTTFVESNGIPSI